jgi:hypothetical protein
LNPSSGNLHPTEAYVIVGALPGLADRPAAYHYAPDRHVLELRCLFDEGVTHPANSKKKKASGGGSGSIAEACPDARPRFKGHLDWAEFPDRTPAPVASIPPLYG